MFNLPFKYSFCFYENSHCLLTYLFILLQYILCNNNFLVFVFLIYICSKNASRWNLLGLTTASGASSYSVFPRLTPYPLSEFLYDSVPSLPISCSIKRLELIVGVIVWHLDNYCSSPRFSHVDYRLYLT